MGSINKDMRVHARAYLLHTFVRICVPGIDPNPGGRFEFDVILIVLFDLLWLTMFFYTHIM